MNEFSLQSILHKYNSDKYNVNIKKEDNHIRVDIYRVHSFWNFSFNRHIKYLILIPGDYASFININFASDLNVNYAAYMKFAEDCFNENNMPDERLDILHSLIGMSGELGEIQEHIKKWIFHGKPLDKVKLISEYGDYEWYKANSMRLLGISLSDVLTANHIKLKTRYPNGRSKNYTLNDRNEEVEDKAVTEHMSNNKKNK